MYLVEDLYREYGEELGFKLIAGKKGFSRRIRVPEAHRPGLSLAGYLKSHAEKRILILGKVEMEYLKFLDPKTRVERLSSILNTKVPALIVARRYRPLKELVTL